MDDYLKKLLYILLFIIIYTIFFCKNDIIEAHNHDSTTSSDDITTSSDDITTSSDDTTTGTDGGVCSEGFICITVNDISIIIDENEVGFSGLIKYVEQRRLRDMYPGLTTRGKKIIYGDTTITLSRDGEGTITYDISTDSRITRTSGTSRSSGMDSDSSHSSDGFFSTNRSPEANSISIKQENNSTIIYIIGVVLLLIGGGIAVFLINKNKGDLEKVGRMAQKNIRSKRTKAKPVEVDVDTRI